MRVVAYLYYNIPGEGQPIISFSSLNGEGKEERERENREERERKRKQGREREKEKGDLILIVSFLLMERER